MAPLRSWLAEVATPILVVVVLDLAVALVFLAVSGKPARIGTLRAFSTVPSKLVELGIAGVSVALVASITRRALDPSLMTLGIAFVLLLDLDHLPSLFGVAQPIRPAHSLTFLVIEAIALALVVKKGSVVLIAVASFFGHLAADTGIFAPFQPFSFQYISLDAYVVPLALVSLVFALAAGHLRRKEANMTPRPM